MKDFNPRKTPFLSVVKLEEVQSSPLENNTLYRKLVGCLLYLTHTRPDISYVVSMDSRHMNHPHDIHLIATNTILKFVQGTKTHGIFYGAKSGLERFTDSDWAGDNID